MSVRAFDRSTALTTPPAPQQPEALAQQERDREDAEPTDEQIDAAVSAWFKGPIMPGRQPFGERMRAAIRAARSSEGDVA